MWDEERVPMVLFLSRVSCSFPCSSPTPTPSQEHLESCTLLLPQCVWEPPTNVPKTQCLSEGGVSVTASEKVSHGWQEHLGMLQAPLPWAISSFSTFYQLGFLPCSHGAAGMYTWPQFHGAVPCHSSPWDGLPQAHTFLLVSQHAPFPTCVPWLAPSGSSLQAALVCS